MDKLTDRLRELAEWADAVIWDVPIDLPDVLREAAAAIRVLTKALEFTIDEAKGEGN